MKDLNGSCIVVLLVRNGHRPTFFQLHLMKTFVLVLLFFSINLKQLSSSSAQFLPSIGTPPFPTTPSTTLSTTTSITSSESPGIVSTSTFTSTVATTGLSVVVGYSFSTSSSQPTQSTSTSSSEKSPRVGNIVGAVVGTIVLASVLLQVLYIRRRNNWRVLNDSENSNPNPFLSLPNSSLNHWHTSTSEVPSLSPQLFPSKFSQRRESVNAIVTASPSGSGSSSLTPLRRESVNALVTASASGSGSSRLTPSRNDPTIRNTETTPFSQPSTSAQGEFLQHADSGIRMPHAERNLVELPPAYTCNWYLSLFYANFKSNFLLVKNLLADSNWIFISRLPSIKV